MPLRGLQGTQTFATLKEGRQRTYAPPPGPATLRLLSLRGSLHEVLLFGRGAGRSALPGRLRDRLCHRGHNALVEQAGDHVILRELLFRDDLGQGAGRGELHLLVHLPRPGVQSAPEDPGEAQGVVDLVWVVATAGSHDACPTFGLLGRYLRVGIRQGEDYGVSGHLVQVLGREYPWHGEAQEEVRPSYDVRELSGQPFGVRVLGDPALHGGEVFALRMDDPFAIQADYVLYPIGEQDLGAGAPRGPDPVDDHLEIL